MTIADAWQLSTHRRLDALDVPAFNGIDLSDLQPKQQTRAARLHRLPTALPRELMRLADWLDGRKAPMVQDLSAIERISLLLRYLASPLRYEPNNTYHVHRAVPSARCIFPVDLVLTQSDGDAKRNSYLYHPSFHALEHVSESQATDDDQSPRCVITGLGRFWKIVRRYGDFTPFPVMLEAGMMIAQLRFLRSALGWTGCSADIGPFKALCSSDLEFPIFAETLEMAELDIAGLPSRDVVLATQFEPAGTIPPFAHLSRFMDLFQRPSEPVPARSQAVQDRPAREILAGDPGFLSTIRSRHSANDLTGMAPMMDEADDLLERFAELATAFGIRRDGLSGEQWLGLRMLWPGRAGPQAGVYDRDARPLALVQARHLAAALAGALPSPGLRYNLPAHSLVLLITVDPHAPGMLAPGAFRDVHIAAGALAQDLCLTAAALGLFARPVRMLHEHVLESALPLSGRIIYTLLCGTSRAANITAELL